MAGVDEAGRGPWAGPVVAAAVILKTARFPILIDDSKHLSPLQRARAFEVISRLALVGIGIVPAAEIDEQNIRRATFQAMRLAIEDLPAKPSLVLVDGRDTLPLDIPCRPITDGDSLSLPIACASIIAKVTRDWLMEFYHRLIPAYRFDRHKGYGTALHQERLNTFGPSVLHRLSFRPVRYQISSFASVLEEDI